MAASAWTPVDETASAWKPVQESAPAQKGVLAKIWDTANKPLADFVLPKDVSTSDVLKAAGFHALGLGAYVPGVNDEHTIAGQPSDTPIKAALKTFIAGSLADTAKTAAGFTSPLALGTMAAGAAGKIPGAVGTLAKAATGAAGAGFALKGVQDVAHAGLEDTPEAWQERLQGGAQIAGGAAAVGEAIPSAVGGVKSALASPAGEAVIDATKAAAKKLPVAGVKRIPYAGKVAGDVINAWREAYKAAKVDATGENVPYAGEEGPPAPNPTDALARLRNQELPPEQPDYVPARPSIERISGEAPKPNAELPAPYSPPAAITPKVVGQQLNDALGGQPLVPGVPLRSQPAAQAAVAGKLPEGFTPVESSALKGYKYNPETREFESITKGGQHYIHGDVSPEEVSTFEAADSKGKAWQQIRNNPLVAKVVSGQRVPVRPVKSMMVEAGTGEASPAPVNPDLMDLLNQSLEQAKGKKLGGPSTVQRLMKGEAGQAGAPGAVTNADEGIADVQNRPVLATKTGEVPARGYLKAVGADESSVLKTQKDIDSVSYHQQQIVNNGTPNVELHVDEGNNIIGAQGRHRAVAALLQGGPNAKVHVTIYRHAASSAE